MTASVPTTAQALEIEVTAAPVNQPTLAQQQIAGLRALIAVLEDSPELATSIDVPLRNLSKHVFADTDTDPKAMFAAFIRTMKAKGAVITKDFESAKYANVYADFGAVRIGVQAYREEVCERVVTGTETVTRTVPDPDVLAAVPTVEVTETVEKYEWVCKPLLAVSSDTKGDGTGSAPSSPVEGKTAASPDSTPKG